MAIKSDTTSWLLFFSSDFFLLLFLKIYKQFLQLDPLEKLELLSLRWLEILTLLPKRKKNDYWPVVFWNSISFSSLSIEHFNNYCHFSLTEYSMSEMLFFTFKDNLKTPYYSPTIVYQSLFNKNLMFFSQYLPHS